jgi:hypothetical protein
MKKFLISIVLLFCFSINAHSQTVWATTDSNGNVTGFYENAAPVPTPPNCCTVMQMTDPRIVSYLAGINSSVASLSFNFGQPNSRTLSFSTLYQAITPTKAAIITVSPVCAATITLTGGSTCIIQLRLGVDNTLTCSTGVVMAQWANGNTGTLTVGLTLTQSIGAPLSVAVPAGGYIMLCQTSGTGATVSIATDQTAG